MSTREQINRLAAVWEAVLHPAIWQGRVDGASHQVNVADLVAEVKAQERSGVKASLTHAIQALSSGGGLHVYGDGIHRFPSGGREPCKACDLRNTLQQLADR